VPGAPAAAGPTRRARADTPTALAKIVDRVLVPAPGGAPKTAGALRDALTEFVWNERSDTVSPGTLGIPLAAPPFKMPVHVATIKPSEDIPALSEIAARSAAPAIERPLAPAAPSSQTTTATVALDPGPAEPAQAPPNENFLPELDGELTVPNPVATEFAALIERVRPWAIRNRIPLASGGALVSISLFIGVMLGNMHHTGPSLPDPVPSASAAPEPSDAAQAARPVEPGGAVSFSIRPWGEIVIDGKATGVSPPLTRVDLPAGRHHIEVRHANAPVWQTDIDLPVNGATGPVTIDHSFE
jgi:hypothetical protein